MNSLISKYNVPAPRYTSYPTVPYWDNKITISQWGKSVKRSFDESNKKDGISIYIHLPYCESLCTYCGCNTRITVNHAVERPYIHSVLKEWKMYLDLFEEKPRIKEIHLGGGTPTFFSPENLRLLIEGIKTTSEICEGADFSIEAHPGNTNFCHLKVLYDLGFKRLSLGIQDFNEKVQHIIHRKQTFEQVKNVAQWARDIGYTSVNFDLIYGLPLQTKESVKDTINKVNQLRPDRIAFYSYAHVPWIKPGQRKFTEADIPDDFRKRALYEMGRDLFIEAGYEEIGMDHFALKSDSLYQVQKKGLLHRNFMGYTHKYTQLMIGLGVSSISDSWYAFAQNIKTIEEYQAVVDKGDFPVFKGHLLSKEDIILRKHILNLMCKMETSWQEAASQCKAVDEAIDLMDEMLKDGLVIKLPQGIRITKKGSPFIRNVCMAFDALLKRKTPETQVFSTAV